jgi:hypothetical protein
VYESAVVDANSWNGSPLLAYHILLLPSILRSIKNPELVGWISPWRES